MAPASHGIRRILFVSQRQAEAMRVPERCCVISITDPDRPEARLRGGWLGVLRLAFGDADPLTFPGANPGLRTMSTAQAERVARFVSDHARSATRIVVHCRHGISRSSAVAKAIAGALGVGFPAGYVGFNRHVHALVAQAMAGGAGPVGMRVGLEPPNQPDVIALIAELDAYQDTLYPAEARYALDLTTLEQAHVLFAVARDDEGTAIGCGAVVLGPDAGELKRMYVRPAHRGRGVAAQVLARLEAESIRRGCVLLQLETGPCQPQALAFYARHGFLVCGAFGDYPEHPLSVFMQKRLGTAEPGA